MAKKSSGDRDPERARPRPMRARSLDKVRRDLERERERAIGALRELGLVPNREEGEPDDVGRPVLDQGDVAQANERQEMSVATRERLARRINRLTAALQRVHDGSYGTCSVCGGPIEPQRLVAVPEAETCLSCQEQSERGRVPTEAA
jgi:DnaK suppressor protein